MHCYLCSKNKIKDYSKQINSLKALCSKIYLIFYKQTNMMKSSRKITININYNLKSNDQFNSLNKSNKTNVYDKIKEILQ